jgi:hypothetical protein
MTQTSGPTVSLKSPDALHVDPQRGKLRACCALEECSTETCMALPDGKTCGDCARIGYCTAIWGQKTDCSVCGYFPRRFAERAAE